MNKMMKKSLVAAMCSLAFLPLVGCGSGKMAAEEYVATAQVTAVDIDVDRAKGLRRTRSNFLPIEARSRQPILRRK